MRRTSSSPAQSDAGAAVRRPRPPRPAARVRRAGSRSRLPPAQRRAASPRPRCARPAGNDFTICFDNQDAGVQHNVDVASTTATAGTLIVAGRHHHGAGLELAGRARQPAGTYFYQCDVHPTTMTGTLDRQVAALLPGRSRSDPRMTSVSVPRPDTSSIPDAPGAYLFRDGDGRVVYVGKARSLRKRLANYWGKPLHPRTAGHDGGRRRRRVDAGLGRGRRADARVQPDPAPPAAVQHPVPRRQVLPVPGADGGGDVAPGAGHAGRQAQERPLLRPVRARLGHPRHARRADPRLPGPHLHELVLRPAGPGQAAVPLLRHRPVLGAVRARGHRRHRGVLPRRCRRARRLPGREHEAGHRAAGARDAGGGRAPGVRAGREAPRSARRGAPGAWRPRRWCSPSPRTST